MQVRALLNQPAQHVLRLGNVLGAFGDAPAVRPGLELPLRLAQRRDQVQNLLPRRVQMAHRLVALALAQRLSAHR